MLIRLVAVMGFLSVALAFFVTELNSPEIDAAQKQIVSPSEQIRQDNAPLLSLLPAGSPDRAEREKSSGTDWRRPNCAEPQEHDEADLCEQRRMSKAAEDALSWNQIQTVVSIFGVIVIIVTLYYNRIATKAAIDAADAADKSAKNAVAALEHAKEVAQADQRAWISIEAIPRSGFKHNDHGASICIDVIMKNIGKLPAYNVGFQAVIELQGRPCTGKQLNYIISDTIHGNPVGIIMPNQTKTISAFWLTLPKDEIGTHSIISMYPKVGAAVDYNISNNNIEERKKTAVIYHIMKTISTGFTCFPVSDDDVNQEQIRFIDTGWNVAT